MQLQPPRFLLLDQDIVVVDGLPVLRLELMQSVGPLHTDWPSGGRSPGALRAVLWGAYLFRVHVYTLRRVPWRHK